MEFTRKKVLALGVVTALPLLFTLSMFIAGFISLFLPTLGYRPKPSWTPPGSVGLSSALVFLFYVVAVPLTCVLIAVYIVHLFRTKAVPNDKKALWAVVIFLGHIVAMPIYWYHYIWRPFQNELSTT